MVTIKEYFTLHINSVFLFLGFLNVISGAILYRNYLERAEFVDTLLIVIPGLMALLGFFTIGIALLGCFGMALKNKFRSIVFFAINLLILTTELVLGLFWCIENQHYMDFPRLIDWFLNEDSEEWSTLQIRSGCCGVNDAYDYVKLNRTVPAHCCQRDLRMKTYLFVSKFHLCYASNVVKPGCITRLTEDFKGDQKIIVIQLLLSGLIKAAILAASFFIPFEQKVQLTENHDSISVASTLSENEEDDKEEEDRVYNNGEKVDPPLVLL